MYKKLSQLSFVIGLFFCIVAVILLATAFQNIGENKLNLFTGVVFLVFGIFMLLVKTNETGPQH